MLGQVYEDNIYMKELIQGFKETLTDGIDKIAAAYDIPEDQHADFIEAVTNEFTDSLTHNGIDKEASWSAIKNTASAAGSAFRGGIDATIKGTDTLSGLSGSGAMLGVGLLGASAIGIGTALGTDAIKGLASMAVDKVSKGFGSRSNRASYEKSFADAVKRSEILQQADHTHLKRMADSIFTFAPRVSSDSNVLTNILVNAVHGDSIDLQTIRAVTELEEKLNKMDN